MSITILGCVFANGPQKTSWSLSAVVVHLLVNKFCFLSKTSVAELYPNSLGPSCVFVNGEVLDHLLEANIGYFCMMLQKSSNNICCIFECDILIAL